MSQLFSRKYLISFFYIIVSIVGISAWQSINVEQAPELNLPSITVSYSWGSTVPEIMEMEITRKVESAANRLRDVSNIRSVTREGSSQVTITFSKQAPVEFRAVEMREYLNNLEEDFPVAVSPASVSRSVPRELEDQQTFLIYTLSGKLEGKDLLEYGQRVIKNKLLGLEGLSDISLDGVVDPALVVEFNRMELERYGLSHRQIMIQINQRLSWRSSGYTETGGDRFSLVIPPNYEQVSHIERMKIDLPGTQRQLELADIATVQITDYPSKTKRRINGNPALTIEFEKEGGADAISLAEQLINRMVEIKAQLPEGMQLRLQYDSTEVLRNQFDELARQAMISGVLVFLVVLIFIRKLSAPLVIMGSVLFSVLLSITFLYVFDYTLNVITLAGLTIALGMLIDNAVVVFEQINPGLPASRQERIAHVSRELPKSLVPVLGGTFTTVGIFVPLLFALDELRLFLFPLAVALTLTLLSSVLIAFTWIPYALIWLSPVKKRTMKRAGGIRKTFTRFILVLLVWRSRFRWVFLLALIGTIGLPLFLIEEPDWDETTWPEFTQVYFNNRDVIDTWIGGLTRRFVNETYFGSPWSRKFQEYITVNIRSPQGTPLEEIDKLVQNYEAIVKPYAHAFTYYEAEISEYFGAYMRFAVNPEYLYDAAPYYFFGEAMYLAARTGNVATSVYGFGDGISTGFGGSSTSHRITLTGYSYNGLYELANDIKSRLEQNRRVREVDINSSGYYSREDFHQYKLVLDRELITSKGLNEYEILQSLSLDLNPANTFGKVEFEGREMYLIGRSEGERQYEEDFVNTIRSTETASFNVGAVAEIKKEKALNEIRRTNQAYERSITLNFLGNYRMGQSYIQSVLEQVPVPVGADIKFGGSFFSFNDAAQSRNLWLIGLLSILSVWMIVSALLESWSGPLFVIMAIPFCGIGIMMGTITNDLAFDRGAIAGALLSIGVVVNNSILLIHQKQLEHTKGIRGLRCWAHIFQKKLRTILITTVTTIVGLLPMLITGSNEFWEALAVIVVWGLLFSTGILLLMSGVWESRKRIRFDSMNTEKK
jgi:multidrug efflux pump subunit AcrB